MKINLLSCSSARPDKRAIAKYIASVAMEISDSMSSELTEILLDGDAVEIEIEDKNLSSVLRDLRKLNIEYEIL